MLKVNRLLILSVFRGGLKQVPQSGTSVPLRNVEVFAPLHTRLLQLHTHHEDLSRPEEDLDLVVQTETDSNVWLRLQTERLD